MSDRRSLEREWAEINDSEFKDRLGEHGREVHFASALLADDRKRLFEQLDSLAAQLFRIERRLDVQHRLFGVILDRRFLVFFSIATAGLAGWLWGKYA